MSMISIAKESEIEKLEKRIDRLQRRTNNKINKLEENFKVHAEAVGKLKDEKQELLEKHNKLKQKYKGLQKKMESSKLAQDVNKKLVVPAKKEIQEDAKLIQYAAEPGGEEKFKEELEKKKQHKKKSKKAEKAIEKLEKEQTKKEKKKEDKQKHKKPENIKKEEGEGKKIMKAMNELNSLVNKKGKIRVKEAAETFEVSEKVIKSLAQSLEKKGKMKVTKPIIGKPILEKVE